MKKYLSFVLLGFLLTGCTVTNDPGEVPVVKETVEVVVEKEDVQSPYTLVEKEFTENNIAITYLQMEDFNGELTQEYINQSLIAVVDKYKEADYFESVEIAPVIWSEKEDVLSITYEGKGIISESKWVEILYPVTIDMKSSAEIKYDNLVNDDLAVRALIEEKVISEGIAETFEAEGIRVYMNDDFVTFAYMPLDDSASTFVRVSLPRELVAPYLNTDFGEHPAS